MCNVCLLKDRCVLLLQVMLMETADRIREQIGVQYPEDGLLHKITTSIPSLA